MSRHAKMLERAARMSERRKGSKNFSFCAILCHGPKIISVGFNEPSKTHTEPFLHTSRRRIYKEGCDTPYHVRTLHAEMSAIRKAKHYQLSKCTLYVARAHNLPSRPCNACLDYMLCVGVQRVYYHTSHGYNLELLGT